MEVYKNINGNSGIYAFEIGPDNIKVQFKDGSIYMYNNVSPGPEYTEKMKLLASRGFGLNSFISTTIKKRYAAKLR